MIGTALLITIDTEGDNVWARPREVTTRNARFLPRFHELCARYGFFPTYLTNYEMAKSPEMVEFGNAVLKDGSGEIGMHLHAWDTPPIVPLTDDDLTHHPPLIAYPEAVVQAKIATMTGLLGETFGVAPRSHRAGRWAFDGRYAKALARAGYRADCSVTPHIYWRYRGLGGSSERVVDYRRAPDAPYHPADDDVCRAGSLALMELPMTVVRTDPWPLRPLRDRLPPLSVITRGLAKLTTPYRWLRPRLGNLASMKMLLDEMLRRGQPYAQMILHSSELMPGGSPYFRQRDDVERLYGDLEALFDHARGRFSGATVGGMAERLAAAHLLTSRT